MNPVADTVQNAAATPEREQPYAALGLKPDEYEQIKQILGFFQNISPVYGLFSATIQHPVE